MTLQPLRPGYWAHTNVGWEPIPNAKPLRIKEWPELELCIHRSVGLLDSDCWTVTEVTTGRELWTARTRRGIQVRVLGELDRVGREKVLATIARALEETGLSPRYRAEEKEGR